MIWFIEKYTFKSKQSNKPPSQIHTCMILKVISDSTFAINLDKNYKGEMKVHVDQLKPFIIPDTSKWTLNVKYLVPALESQLFQGINVFINFQALDTLTLQLLNSDIKKVL